MAALTVQTISETELEATYANADTGSGDTVKNKNGNVFLHLKNPGASSATVTITAQSTSKNVSGYGPLAKADKVVSLDAGEENFVGPFPAAPWNNSSDNLELTYGGAGAADVDVAALVLG